MKLTKLFESIIVKNLDRASSQFKTNINKMINGSAALELYDEDGFYPPNQVYIEFGKNGLPTESNTVYVGNRYYDKMQQYKKLKNKVSLIKTYTDAIEVSVDRMIAKKKNGFRGQGQLINELPSDPEDYIFQHLVEIQAEFRVIVYYMNFEYHVSGIYKKTGSNVSISQISQSSGIGKAVADIAVKATKGLSYGLGGVDVALLSAKHINDLILTNESVSGFVASKAMKLVGKINNMDELLNDSHLVVLEVNSLPSMANKGISYDLLQSINSNSV